MPRKDVNDLTLCGRCLNDPELVGTGALVFAWYLKDINPQYVHFRCFDTQHALEDYARVKSCSFRIKRIPPTTWARLMRAHRLKVITARLQGTTT